MTNVYAYSIKNQWINMSLYFINFMYNTKKPFGKRLVGKILNSKVFRYAAFFSSYGMVFLNPIGIILLLKYPQIADFSLYLAADYLNLFGPDDSYGQPSVVCRYITTPDRLSDNNERLGAGERNSKWLANGDFIKTNFIKLDKTDIVKFFENTESGFSLRKNQLNNSSYYMRHSNHPLPSIYYNFSNNVTNQERDQNNLSIYNDNDEFYFLKGINNNDIIITTIFKKLL